MQIGNVAERSGVPAKTIRYYESIGLIPSAVRTLSGYRIYDEVGLRTLQFIQRARGLGFSVSEVAGLLALWRDHSRASADVKQLAQNRIAHVERKIEELQAMKHALLDLAERCQGGERPECPIIDELAGAVGTD
jgi:MerR family transcriptional regulator, copper efflux regulator